MIFNFSRWSTRLASIFCFVFCVCFLSGCNNQTKKSQWKNVEFDASLAKSKNYKVVCLFGNGKAVDLKDTATNPECNYQAYLADENKLSLSFGVNGLLVGWGFDLTKEDKKYSVHPYSFMDIRPFSEPEYEILHQKLILNKENYKVGDSLFGRIELKAIEKIMGTENEIVAIGNFKTVVRKDFDTLGFSGVKKIYPKIIISDPENIYSLNDTLSLTIKNTTDSTFYYYIGIDFSNTNNDYREMISDIQNPMSKIVQISSLPKNIEKKIEVDFKKIFPRNQNDWKMFKESFFRFKLTYGNHYEELNNVEYSYTFKIE